MRSRIAELLPLAEQNDGLVTAAEARSLGITDSVLARLTQRGKLERVARGVYRIPYFPADPFSQYREAVLWAREPRSRAGCALARNRVGCVWDLRCESRAHPSHCPEARETPAPETEMGRNSSRRFAAERCDDPQRPAGHDRCQECDGRNGNDGAVGTGPPSHQGCAPRRLY